MKLHDKKYILFGIRSYIIINYRWPFLVLSTWEYSQYTSNGCQYPEHRISPSLCSLMQWGWDMWIVQLRNKFRRMRNINWWRYVWCCFNGPGFGMGLLCIYGMLVTSLKTLCWLNYLYINAFKKYEFIFLYGKNKVPCFQKLRYVFQWCGKTVLYV